MQKYPQAKPDKTPTVGVMQKSVGSGGTNDIPVPSVKNKGNKKRERPPDEKSNEGDSDKDEPSSQNSVVIPRNIVKLKRVEKQSKK